MNQNLEKEIKILNDLLKKLESDDTSILLRSWFNPVFWLLCAVTFLICFGWYEQTGIPTILVVSSGIIGIAIGAVSVLQNGEKHWYLMRRHFDKESVREALHRENT